MVTEISLMKSILPARVGACGARYGYQLPLHFSHFTFYCPCISVDSVAITDGSVDFRKLDQESRHRFHGQIYLK
jgi:hypothetical protein